MSADENENFVETSSNDSHAAHLSLENTSDLENEATSKEANEVIEEDNNVDEQARPAKLRNKNNKHK